MEHTGLKKQLAKISAHIQYRIIGKAKVILDSLVGDSGNHIEHTGLKKAEIRCSLDYIRRPYRWKRNNPTWIMYSRKRIL